MTGDLLRRAVIRLGRIVAFALYFSYEFLASNAVVLREILSWRRRAAPALVEMPLHSRSKLEIVSISNLLTLTPGTLVVEVMLDPPTLFVHGMFAGDVAAFRQQIATMERRMLAAFRPVDQWPQSPEVVSR